MLKVDGFREEKKDEKRKFWALLEVINEDLAERGLERFKPGTKEPEVVPFQITAADLEHTL
jgi:hypothetical protein